MLTFKVDVFLKQMRELISWQKKDSVYDYDVAKYKVSHIVSLEQIFEVPGFDQLTREQKLEVANQ